MPEAVCLIANTERSLLRRPKQAAGDQECCKKDLERNMVVGAMHSPAH